MPPAPCYCRLSLAVIAAAAGPLLMALPPPAAAASAASAAAAPTVVHVKDGRLVAGGTWVGTHTSQLAANIVAPLFPAVTAADWQETSMINATMGLRHLVLEGDYLADVPLSLPSLFVLQLLAGSTITPAANLSLQNTTTFTGLVQMHGSCQLAISPPYPLVHLASWHSGHPVESLRMARSCLQPDSVAPANRCIFQRGGRRRYD